MRAREVFVPVDQFARLVTGSQRCVVVFDPYEQIRAADTLYLVEQMSAASSASAFLTSEGSGGRVTGRASSSVVSSVLRHADYTIASIGRVWSHAGGNVIEAQIAAVEHHADRARALSHPGCDGLSEAELELEQRKAIGLIAAFVPPDPLAPKRFELTDD